MKSIRLCFCPGVFGIIIFFVNFGIALEKYVNLCVTELSYLGKYFSLQHEKNRPKMGIRFGFLKFLKSLGITVFDVFYNENLYYLLFLWKYLKSKKHLVPEIRRKIPSAYQLHLETKLMKKPYFLRVDTNSWKLKLLEKLLGGHGQKWLWPLWSSDSKVSCISGMKRWNRLVFYKSK